jgi:pimeloyl-ACP methyl ester carboxylesterase
MTIATRIDSALAHWSARRREHVTELPGVRYVNTEAGVVRVLDSGSNKPCVVFVPDGPNVIEHYRHLTELLAPRLRVVCFDLPGFGFSIPSKNYGHSLDQGAGAVLAILGTLGIAKATLGFSCANGFYALRVARLAPSRVASLLLAQTPSVAAMHAWVDHIIPSTLKIPAIGQVACWLLRRKAAHGWYDTALPRNMDREPFRRPAMTALESGGCFCLAGIVQGLMQESAESLIGVTAPCTMIWGAKDHSHRHTNAASLLDCIPHASIVRFDDCGHFPDLEQPQRYASQLLQHIAQHQPAAI